MLAAVYLALYLGTGWVVGPLGGDLIDYEDLFADALSVFLAVGVPVIVGSILLVAFAWSLGWMPRPLFAGSRWAAAGGCGSRRLSSGTSRSRVFGTEYSRYSAGVIPVTFLVGTSSASRRSSSRAASR